MEGGADLKGKIFSIEEFSVYDGPGIRTSIFLKGCPLRCSWCHNPEGQRSCREYLRNPNGCLQCGACTAEGGALSEESIGRCPKGLVRGCGDDWEAQALSKKLLKNKELLDGVTFSGGEPLMQHEFLLECLALLKNELQTAVQTSGYCDPLVFQKALQAADYFLYDLKLMDEGQHLRYTGVSNRKILQNFDALAKSGKPFTVRVPLIPGVIDTEQNLTAIAEHLLNYDIRYLELLPYNKMAGAKYKAAGRIFAPDYDETQESNPRLELFKARGIKAKLY